MRRPDFNFIPNLHTVMVSLVFSVIACSVISFLPEFGFQVITQVETSFDLEREGERELNEMEDDQKQIIPECDQYFYSVMENIFPRKSVSFPGLYTFTFTPPPELIKFGIFFRKHYLAFIDCQR